MITLRYFVLQSIYILHQGTYHAADEGRAPIIGERATEKTKRTPAEESNH